MSYRSQKLTLFASAAETASATGAGVVFREAFSTALVTLNVTSAAAASGDTLDVYIDSSADGGATWFNVGHFTQVLGNGGAKTFVMALGASAPGTSSVASSATNLAAGATLQYGIGDRLRKRSVIAGSTPNFTYSVVAFLK
jgi:hypothetical protein